VAKAKAQPSLRARALRALARRELSRAELQAKLLPHVAETDDLGALLDDLEKRGWLSDARALEQIVRIRGARFGTQRIAHELRQKGISEELINASIPQMKESELEAARNVWQRKFATPPQDQKEKARQVRFLQSRGFSMEVIFRVMRISDLDE
jgi:regulatory protein